MHVNRKTNVLADNLYANWIIFFLEWLLNVFLDGIVVYISVRNEMLEDRFFHNWTTEYSGQSSSYRTI